ncbi:MAG: FHA domain-containing protein [Myxococcota bacterium]|jgi:hypothetical protein|nr:FHA domain-containing protein [Myxococcota bacterium]
MASIIVLEQGRQIRMYRLYREVTVIGRGEKSDLRLPNVSVSRAHLRIRRTAEGFVAEDLGSQNGSRVAGARFETHSLSTGDVMQVGKFLLHFRGDDMEATLDRFDSELLPNYHQHGSEASQESTFAVTDAQLRRTEDAVQRVHGARLVRVDGDREVVKLGTGAVSLGGSEGVAVEGARALGVAATIAWDGKRHVLTKDGWLAKVMVNGESVKSRALESEDELTVGATRFRYLVVS